MRSLFRRGPAPPEPATDDPPEPAAGHRGDDHVGHALRAPSALHAFNRYEIKYLLPSPQVPELRAELAGRLDVDSHGADGGYGVWSTYYDTRDLRFYWEKIEGLRFRR